MIGIAKCQPKPLPCKLLRRGKFMFCCLFLSQLMLSYNTHRIYEVGSTQDGIRGYRIHSTDLESYYFTFMTRLSAVSIRVKLRTPPG